MPKGKKPNANALWKKYMKPSRKPPKDYRTPQQDLWTGDQGNNITRPAYDPKTDPHNPQNQ